MPQAVAVGDPKQRVSWERRMRRAPLGPVLRGFFRVLLPMFWPSMLAGSSLLFAVSMGAFGTAFALSGTGLNIMPLVIYTQTSDVTVNIAEADALAVTLAVVTTLVVWVYESLNSRAAPAER